MNVAINGFLLARGRSSVFTRCNMFLRFVLLCAYKDYYDHCDYYDDGNFFRNSVSFPVSEAIFIVIMIIVIWLLLLPLLLLLLLQIRRCTFGYRFFLFLFFVFLAFTSSPFIDTKQTDIQIYINRHKKKKTDIRSIVFSFTGLTKMSRMFFNFNRRLRIDNY